jgi:hypothetical protein
MSWQGFESAVLVIKWPELAQDAAEIGNSYTVVIIIIVINFKV